MGAVSGRRSGRIDFSAHPVIDGLVARRLVLAILVEINNAPGRFAQSEWMMAKAQAMLNLIEGSLRRNKFRTESFP
jgi:hypothetical protein